MKKTTGGKAWLKPWGLTGQCCLCSRVCSSRGSLTSAARIIAGWSPTQKANRKKNAALVAQVSAALKEAALKEPKQQPGRQQQ